MSTKSGQDAHECDAQIRHLYREHARAVDVDLFAAGLGPRLARASKRRARRPLVRGLSLVMAGLIVAAGLGIGGWQVVQHLSKPQEVLVIGATETASTGSSAVEAADAAGLPSAAFSSEEPRLVSELKLADVWARTAAALALDPSTARVGDIQIVWDGEGLLSEFHLSAVTPQGQVVWLAARPDLDAKQGYMAFRAGINSSSASSPSMRTGPVLMTVEQVLLNLDEAGLMEIATQSGVEVAGDPAELWQAAREQGVFGPADDSTQIFKSTDVVDRVLWTLNDSFQNLAFVDDAGQLEDLLKGAPLAPVILGVWEGHVTRLRVSDLASLSFPLTGLTLGRIWKAKDKATGQETSHVEGADGAIVLLRPSTEEQAAAGGTLDALPVDARLEGLAFTTADGSVCLVREGTTQTVWKPDARYGRRLSASLGVSYSLNRQWLLYAAGILHVTDGQSATTTEVLGDVLSGSGEMRAPIRPEGAGPAPSPEKPLSWRCQPLGPGNPKNCSALKTCLPWTAFATRRRATACGWPGSATERAKRPSGRQSRLTPRSPPFLWARVSGATSPSLPMAQRSSTWARGRALPK